jgi:Uma2 family endonuclease
VTHLLHTLLTTQEFKTICDAPEDQEHLLELIHGEVVEKMPTEEHAAIAAMLAYLLMSFVMPRQLGRVTVEARYSAAGGYTQRTPIRCCVYPP